MLNKLQLNNLIITNKKQIQKGHTQAINKQVQKLRKLKGWLEKHTENEKIKEKYRKATETLAELKKLKRQAIVKHCLVLDKPASSIVTNGRSTPEEVAIALLAMNKIVRDLVANFKEQLNLAGEADASWKEEIMASSKRRAKIQRTEEKRKKRLVAKEQKAITKKRLEWLKENKTEGDDAAAEAPPTQPQDLSVTSSGVWKEEDTADNSAADATTAAETVEKPKKTLKKEKIKRDVRKPAKGVDTLVNSALGKTIAVAEKVKKPLQKVKRETLTKSEPPKRVKLDVEVAVKQEEEKAAEEEPFSYVEDPFFITETGESYLSTAVVDKNKQNDIGSDASDEDESAYHRNRHQNRRERNFERLNNRHSSSASGRVPEPKAPKIDENLHPSWKAKLKVKPVIGKFQGTKITFNEDGPQQSVGVPKEAAAKEKLHPSWEAKQKLKPVITSFQGKKITFDNDDA